MPSLLNHPATKHAVWNFMSYSIWTLWNKKIFSDFGGLPLLSTALQMGVVTLIVMAVQAATGQGRGEKASEEVLYKLLVPLSVVRSCDLGLANLALSAMSVAGQQILKSTIPVWVCVLSVVYLRRKVSAMQALIVLVIVCGTAMATVGDPDVTGTTFGIVCMLFSCFCRAGKCVINTTLLQGLPTGGTQQPKLHKLTLLRYEAPMSGCIIMVGCLCFELPHLIQLAMAFGFTWPTIARFASATLVNGALMFLNQVTYLAIVEHTSPVASQALMNIKMIFLILFSTLFYPLHLSVVNGLGMALAGIGAAMYSIYSDSPPKKSSEVAI
ncbi:solute carrier family 35 [Diplonema papillatum]|nr:solute carrier family 35 [Diplonema papillatum]|eukprot:gene3037-4771_t